MNKDTNSTSKANNNKKKYFVPDETLINWTSERLGLENERNEFDMKKSAGEKLSTRWYTAMKSSGARKADILDEIIFPSLANLIYFSEAIKSNPKLDELFESDEIELFGSKLVEGDISFLEKGGDPSSSKFYQNNLARFISNILTIDKSKVKEHLVLQDFRLSLFYQVQSIIRDMVKEILKEYGSIQIFKSAGEDFDNTLRWLAFIAKSSSEKSDFEYKREIRIEPKDYLINYKASKPF